MVVVMVMMLLMVLAMVWLLALVMAVVVTGQFVIILLLTSPLKLFSLGLPINPMARLASLACRTSFLVNPL